MAELNELAAKQAAIAAEIAEAKRAARVANLNDALTNAKNDIAAFVGVEVEKWGEASAEVKAEIAEFMSDLAENLLADAPAKVKRETGERLTGDAKAKRDADIVAELAKGAKVADVAAKFGLSEGLINVIKKTAGLTKPRLSKDHIKVNPVNLAGNPTS
jgi:hypothetical protein